MDKPIRTGTFLCWLFGHCFLKKIEQLLPDKRYEGGFKKVTSWNKFNYCIRCGIERTRCGGLDVEALSDFLENLYYKGDHKATVRGNAEMVAQSLSDSIGKVLKVSK